MGAIVAWKCIEMHSIHLSDDTGVEMNVIEFV